MNIIHCDISNVDLAVDAMVTIKCVEDGKPIELATVTAMTTFLENPFNHLLVAVDGSETVGYLIAYELQRPDREQSMMFLYDITVVNKHRQKGIGTALIEQLKFICSTKPMMKMFVPTNRSNEPAVGLYQKTGAVLSSDTDEVGLAWIF
ncbi:MAG: GNAT family N-acetyltransferase [Dehalococcoidia bacterium]|jgi:ribosomal protein S18 acetylase RimI-like enzyme